MFVAKIFTIQYLIMQSFHFRVVSTASGSREAMWLCSTAWAISLDAKFIPSCPKTGIRREFHALPRFHQIVHQKQKPPCSRNPVNYTEVFLHSQLCLGSNVGISKGTFVWRLLNRLEGLWSRISGLSSALKGCWQPQVFFWILHSPGGDRPRPSSSEAPKYHFHLSNKTI